MHPFILSEEGKKKRTKVSYKVKISCFGSFAKFVPEQKRKAITYGESCRGEKTREKKASAACTKKGGGREGCPFWIRREGKIADHRRNFGGKRIQF